jgi:hypothetical protein
VTVDQTINSWVAPIADWLSAVVFYAVPIGDTKLPLILVWLIMGGIVCTLAFRFVNLRGFRHSARVIRGDYSSKDHPGEATPFQALSTAVSGTVGLGAIGGVAVAVSLGGPGAAFWMVIAGFLGMSTKFRRSHAGREIPPGARRRHGVGRRHALCAGGAAADRPARVSANSSRVFSAWQRWAVRSPSSRSTRLTRSFAWSPASTRRSCSG